jgi:hypothetical protein
MGERVGAGLFDGDGGESVVARTENEPEEEESVNLDENPPPESAQC